MVFTEYAATLDWIAGSSPSAATGTASSWPPSRARRTPRTARTIRAQFTAPPDKHPVRVLVATDSAGEGIDLQDYCHRLVNFDIPFNPSRLEQRIGRIDRYGQQNIPEIYQLTPGPRDSRSTRETCRFLIGHRHAEDRARWPPTSDRSTRSSTWTIRSTSPGAPHRAQGQAVAGATRAA